MSYIQKFILSSILLLMLNPYVDEISGDNQFRFEHKSPTCHTCFFHKMQNKYD